MPGRADFLLTDDCRTLRVRAIAGLDPDTLEHLILDQVLPRMLAQQGELMLHASAVAVAGRVGIFLGESGRGKSTLSAILRQQGHPILSDDCVLVRDRGRTIRVVPTYPSLRLWPDVLFELGLDPRVVGRLADYSQKQRLVVDCPEVPPEGLPLAAIYILEEPASHHSTPAIKKVSPSRSCLELIRNTFTLDPSDVRRAADFLARTANVAERVPVFSLTYPRNLSALAGFASQISEHARQQGSREANR